MKKITLRLFRHRGKMQIGLHFPYDNEVKTMVMQLPFVRWTKTYGRFYMPNTESCIQGLDAHCHGHIWVDQREVRISHPQKADPPPLSQKSEFKEKGSQSSVKSREYKHQISPLTLRKIDEVRKWMEQKRYSRNTIKVYISFIKQFFGDHPELEWDALTLQIIHEYNHSRFIVRKMSYASQNQWINAIKLYMKVQGLLHFSVEDIERPRKARVLPEVLSQEDIVRIIKSIRNNKHRAIIMLIYGCGLRIGEVLNLRPGDLRYDEGLIYIREAKGKKDRRVPISGKLADTLKGYASTYRPKHYFFEGAGGGKYSHSSARAILRRALATCGLAHRKITLHTLRHSYATHLTNNGVNIQYLQEILGHASPKTTMLYTHLSGKDIRNIRSPLEDLDI